MIIEICAFCGRTIRQVEQIVRSPVNDGIYICEKCAQIAISVFNGEINKKSAKNLRKHWESLPDMEIMKRKSRWDDVVFVLV